MNKLKDKNFLRLLVGLSVIGLVIICTMIIILFVSLNIKPQNNNSNQPVTSYPESNIIQKNNETSPVSYESTTEELNLTTSQTYESTDEGISATLPIGWKLIVYSDVSGMKENGYIDQPGTTFSGITGFKIFNESNNLVFSLSGVDGIGGSGGCRELAVFEDTDQSYVDSIVVETLELGFGDTNLIDLKSVEYSGINFFGARFRRFGTELYKAKIAPANSFNTACGIDGMFITMPDIEFNVLYSDGTTYDTNVYQFSLSNINSDLDLGKLDSVLNSLKVESL